MAERRRLRPRVWALALAVVMVSAGCASVPSSGAVHVGDVVPGIGGLSQDDIRVIPSGPLHDAGVDDIVTGFLDAQVDEDGAYASARTYLAPGAVWHPGPTITTYDESTLVARATSATTVTVTARRAGTIDADGLFHADPGTLTRHFRLIKVAGQWRIATLSSGGLLGSSDVRRVLEPATLYYADEAGNGLLPQQVLLPTSESSGLATTLVNRDLEGPPGVLASVVHPLLPFGSQVIGNVPIDGNGVAEVNLPPQARALSTQQLQLLSASLVWTFRQLAGVTGMRLLAAGEPLSGPGVPAVQATSSWSEYGPDAGDPSPGALYAARGHVHGLGIPVPQAMRGLDLSDPVVGDDGRVAAGLQHSGGRTSLLTGPVSGRLRSRVTGQAMTAPVVDPAGDVVVAVAGPGGTEVAAVTPTGRVERISVPASVTDEHVSALALTRDGARLALVAGEPGHRSLQTAVFGHDAHGIVVSATTTVVSGGSDVLAAAWAGASQVVALLGEDHGTSKLDATDPAGYQHSGLKLARLPAGAVTGVAAAPGHPFLVAVAGRLYRSDGESWRPVTAGTMPSYAG